MYIQVELPPLIPPWEGGKEEIQFPPLCKAIAGGLWVWFPASDRETINPVPSPIHTGRVRWGKTARRK